jgi:hypothetical protein
MDNELRVYVFIILLGIAFWYSGFRSRKKRKKMGETIYRSDDASSLMLGITFVIIGIFKIILRYAN